MKIQVSSLLFILLLHWAESWEYHPSSKSFGKFLCMQYVMLSPRIMVFAAVNCLMNTFIDAFNKFISAKGLRNVLPRLPVSFPFMYT